MGWRIADTVMSIKRALRPLIPDAVMARYRLRQHSKAARVNVDVAVESDGARRWLATTPDTYRIVDPAALDETTHDVIVLTEGNPDDGALALAAALISRPDIGMSVVGEVEAPRLVDRRRAEPVVAPVGVVIRPEVLAEIGGEPPGRDLPALLARVRDAGHRIGLVPVTPSDADPVRRDAIGAEPVVVLAAVPLHDVGGGSRGAQIALELVSRGYHVTYVYLYPSYEDVDLGLRYIHPRLEQVRFDRFYPGVHVERTGGVRGVVLLELPAPSYEHAIATLREARWAVVYDIIDDWHDPSLGGDWFDSRLEEQLVRSADAVVASAPDLVDRANDSGREASLVPNAVNASLFSPTSTRWPDDLPDGRVIGYHGSLYGDWFDWDAVRRVAAEHPDATIALIGEARGVPGDLPDNVALLGLKPQHELPAYVRQFDVGIVPFELTATTHAVSPLKVYEYLASGVPVAAPPLRALDGLEGVYTDVDLCIAVNRALDARRPDPSLALGVHAWGPRVEAIFAAIGRPLADPTHDPVKVAMRPAVHYPRGERKVGGGATDSG